MEQYWMPKKLNFRNLRLCLENYNPTYLFIRDCGGIRENGGFDCHGKAKVNADLKDKILDFRKDKSGLHMLIDTWEVFHFPLRTYYKGFSLAYERIEPSEDGIGRIINLGCGIDPYDPKLPEPKKSILRTILDDHLMEIEFEGRVNLKFHSWKEKPLWKYWTIAKPTR
ncbi:Uncharacterised protein [uncultured archaeon]|nr:Uncharacterised protein [uncultured archaeon]